MKQKRVLMVLNVSLGLVAVLLLLNLFDVQLPNLGQTQYLLDSDEPLCLVGWQAEFNEWNDLNACCLEARKQLGCSSDSDGWMCQTGSDGIKYWLNSKAYNYCTQQSIWR
jgi:hypothetical protein